MPVRPTRDGIVVTEHFDDEPYIESTLRVAETVVRDYVERIPHSERRYDVMRELMPGIGSQGRVTDFIAQIRDDADRDLARQAVEYAMLAMQAHEHVLVKSVEREVIEGLRLARGRSRGGMKAATEKRSKTTERDARLVAIARKLIDVEGVPGHLVVSSMIDRGHAKRLSDDTLRAILQNHGIIKKKKAARS